MKCTADGDSWAHVVCALWVPEVRFVDTDHREPISNISDIPNERWTLRYFFLRVLTTSSRRFRLDKFYQGVTFATEIQVSPGH